MSSNNAGTGAMGGGMMTGAGGNSSYTTKYEYSYSSNSGSNSRNRGGSSWSKVIPGFG